jgi:hypothetical protein
MLQDEFDKLTPAQRAHYAFEAFRLHFDRAIAQLPKDQQDSVTSANKMLEQLKQLEAEMGKSREAKPPELKPEQHG